MGFFWGGFTYNSFGSVLTVIDLSKWLLFGDFSRTNNDVHKLKTYCWYRMVVLCAILDFSRQKSVQGQPTGPLRSLGHISDLRWISGPQTEENTQYLPAYLRQKSSQTIISCAEKARKKRQAQIEYSLLVYYTVLLESLQQLAPWRMLRSSRMQWLHVRQSFMGSLSQRDTKTDVFAEFLIFFNGVSAQEIKVITCQKYKRCSSNLAV